MKYLNFALLSCLCLLLLSCDDEEVLDFFEDPEVDITTNIVLPVEIFVDPLSDPNQSVSFEKIGIYDLITNPQIAEEIGTPEQIKNVVVNSVTYEFKDFSGNTDTEVEGVLRLFTWEGNMPFGMPSVNVAEADLFENVYTLNNSFNAVNDGITRSKLVGYVYFGTASKNPAFFTLEVVFNITATLELNLDDL